MKLENLLRQDVLSLENTIKEKDDYSSREEFENHICRECSFDVVYGCKLELHEEVKRFFLGCGCEKKCPLNIYKIIKDNSGVLDIVGFQESFNCFTLTVSEGNFLTRYFERGTFLEVKDLNPKEGLVLFIDGFPSKEITFESLIEILERDFEIE